MKKYIDYKQFEDIIDNLKLNEETKIFVEYCDSGEADAFRFKRMELFDYDGVFFESPTNGYPCILQDDFVDSGELKYLWEDFTNYGENKIYIEE